MASGTLGTSRVKISNLNFNRARVGEAHESHLRITWTVHKSQNHAGLRITSRTDDQWRIYSTSSSGSQYGSKTSGFPRRHAPDLSEVGSLITGICEASSVKEFEMKLEGFQLYLLRNPTRKTTTLPPSPQLHAPAKADATAEEPVASALLPETSLAITKSIFSVSRWQITLKKAANEGLVVLQSPKVGFFKRSRTIKGTRAPPACKERQMVKEGQVVCYIDQLGGEMPIKADVSGEVIKILLEDGDPVGYEDALITILPISPEIKMLQ
ncbi:uncharacterized protein LOC115678456 [Syzygium oleosum]|uniref:uncharacterized protein LOC115678456 n=1 Tax=Syzygium oleosum TaxID=219896 RepID=UPI0011D28209|nr:uncharacterized protein LOC115678456 [Syzygium oleosum]